MAVFLKATLAKGIKWITVTPFAHEIHQEQLDQRITITTIIVNSSQSYISKLHYKKIIIIMIF